MKSSKIIISRKRGTNSVTSIGGVKRLVRVNEDVVLNQQLRTLAGVDTIGDREVVVVVDVTGTETERRTTGVQVVEEVTDVGDSEMTLVLGTVRVRVTDEGCLPVVVEEVVGKGNVVRGVGDIEESIVIILKGAMC